MTERFLCAHKKKACVKWKVREFLCLICMETTTHPCFQCSISLHISLLHYVNFFSTLSGCCFLASLSSVCVCLPLLLCFSLLVTGGFHGDRHHHHHQYDSYTSIFLQFEGAIFLSAEGKKQEHFYPPLVNWDGLKNVNKNTSNLISKSLFFFSPITFWIRVRGW